MQNEKIKPIVSFDFDSTLANSVWGNGGWDGFGCTLEPIQKVIDILHEKHNAGNDIIITSFRYGHELAEVFQFIKEYKLPVKHVIGTGRKDKTPHLIEHKVTEHYDDYVEVCVLAEVAGIKTYLIVHPDSEKNCMSEELDKIFL